MILAKVVQAGSTYFISSTIPDLDSTTAEGTPPPGDTSNDPFGMSNDAGISKILRSRHDTNYWQVLLPNRRATTGAMLEALLPLLPLLRELAWTMTTLGPCLPSVP